MDIFAEDSTPLSCFMQDMGTAISVNLMKHFKERIENEEADDPVRVILIAYDTLGDEILAINDCCEVCGQNLIRFYLLANLLSGDTKTSSRTSLGEILEDLNHISRN